MESIRYIPLTNGGFASVDEVDYERVAGHRWHWKRSHGRSRTPYAYASMDGVKVAMHRLLTAADDGFEVDHRDGNGLNNCRQNLRVCTHANNQQNRAKKKNGSSRYKGVAWNKLAKKWSAQIRHEKRSIYLGLFHDERVAAEAYDRKAVELFGEFARPNFEFPREDSNLH